MNANSASARSIYLIIARHARAVVISFEIFANATRRRVGESRSPRNTRPVEWLIDRDIFLEHDESNIANLFKMHKSRLMARRVFSLLEYNAKHTTVRRIMRYSYGLQPGGGYPCIHVRVFSPLVECALPKSIYIRRLLS